MISETKLDDSFPVGQFKINGFATPYRLDRNKFGGGIMLYVREDIPSKQLNISNKTTETMCIEINLRKKKWLLISSYNPHKNLIKEHLKVLASTLDSYSSKYDNFILLGDLNCETSVDHMNDFCKDYSLSNLTKMPTCYKNPDKPTCIDLMLTNHPLSFQNSCVVETGLSDFHQMTVTVLKSYFKKLEPKIIFYRDYKTFSNEAFRDELHTQLSTINWLQHENKFDMFINTCINILDKHAPKKQNL